MKGVKTRLMANNPPSIHAWLRSPDRGEAGAIRSHDQHMAGEVAEAWLPFCSASAACFGPDQTARSSRAMSPVAHRRLWLARLMTPDRSMLTAGRGRSSGWLWREVKKAARPMGWGEKRCRRVRVSPAHRGWGGGRPLQLR